MGLPKGRTNNPAGKPPGSIEGSRQRISGNQ